MKGRGGVPSAEKQNTAKQEQDEAKRTGVCAAQHNVSKDEHPKGVVERWWRGNGDAGVEGRYGEKARRGR